MQAASVSDIGKIVAAARRQRNLTQAQLAKAVGASQYWISQVESGKPKAQIGKVLGVLAYLGVRLQVGEAPWLTRPTSIKKKGQGISLSLNAIIAAHSGNDSRHKKARR